jgi:hypothetical protein
MPRLFWKKKAASSCDPLTGDIHIGCTEADEDIPAALAHELAHQDAQIFPLSIDDAEKVFYKEMDVWEHAFQHLPRHEVNTYLMNDTLGGYLEDVKDSFGNESIQFRQARRAYIRFIRKYFKDEPDLDIYARED